MSSDMVEWALDTCMAEAPERPLGGLNSESIGAGNLLHRCASVGIVSPRIARLLRHQLKERLVN